MLHVSGEKYCSHVPISIPPRNRTNSERQMSTPTTMTAAALLKKMRKKQITNPTNAVDNQMHRKLTSMALSGVNRDKISLLTTKDSVLPVCVATYPAEPANVRISTPQSASKPMTGKIKRAESKTCTTVYKNEAAKIYS